jgi:hypothetical protein
MDKIAKNMIPNANSAEKNSKTQRDKTLALHGLEELFLQLCCCASFFVLAGNRFWFYILPYVLRVPYSCGVVLVFFNLAGNSFWYLRT